jgi:homoserine kinase type II
MATYTQLKQNEIQILANNYNLKVTEFEAINGGNGNSSYKLTTAQGKYVLTVCDDKTFDEVSVMAKLLLLLQQNNFPCTRVIPSQNKDLITFYSNKPVMLKGYIEGQVIDSLNTEMLVQLGAETARLHQIPAPDYLPTNHPYGRAHFPQVMGLNIDAKYESWLKQKIDELEQNIPSNLPRALIHGDLFFDNLLFEQTTFNAIIDFEEACNYYMVFELGMAIIGSCAHDDVSINLEKAGALLEGYQQIRSLEQIEKDTLQMFVQYAATATSYWRFDKYNIDSPEAEKADKHWQMVQLSDAVRKIPSSHFMDAIFNVKR